jgi:hypothetical protein
MIAGFSHVSCTDPRRCGEPCVYGAAEILQMV